MEKPIDSRLTFLVLITLAMISILLGAYFGAYTENKHGKFLFSAFAIVFVLACVISEYERWHQIVAFLNELDEDKEPLDAPYAIFLLKTYQEQSPWIKRIMKKIEKDLEDKHFRDSFYSQLKKEGGFISQKADLLILCEVKDALQNGRT